jgi:isoquinoline 1-oxidoreductase beta subunit
MHKVKQSGLSRRSFLLGTAALGAGLTVAVYLNRRNDSTRIALSGDAAENVKLEWDPQAFVHVGSDNRVTVYSKHTEMGQGIYTGLATVVAEELDAAWEQMQVESAPANAELYVNLSWGEQATGGSSSLRNSFQQMRQVGAATRAMLVNAAAQQWDVPAGEIVISNGVLRHESSGNSAPFGELAELAAAGQVPESVVLKPIGEYTLSVKNLRRVDVEDKINGQARFTQDFSLPDMRIAVVAHAPRFGGRVASYDDTKARSVPGVDTVFEIPTEVAVIARSFWAAQKARQLLPIEWDESSAFKMSSGDIVEHFRP